MAKIIRPIKFDPPKLDRRRKRQRATRKKREDRRWAPGGEFFYCGFWHRLQNDSFWLKHEGNDNRACGLKGGKL